MGLPATPTRKEVVVSEEESVRLMEAMEYLKTGASYREAAKQYGFSTTYLWRRGKEFGLMSRKLGVITKLVPHYIFTDDDFHYFYHTQ